MTDRRTQEKASARIASIRHDMSAPRSRFSVRSKPRPVTSRQIASAATRKTGCHFSWNRDPATELIFIQSGPRGVGSTLAFRDWEAGIGMLVVETIAKIRRAYFTLGKPIKEICRELRISRKVVRKVIRSNATEFHYERSRQPQPRIGPWRERLEALLEENESKATRERLTLIRIYEELRDLGYEGSYAAVRRYAIAWREKRASATADAYVPLTFAPGEAYQFDWSHEIVLMDGVTTTVKVAHVRLCHSRMMFVRAYPRETQEMVFDAHEWAFLSKAPWGAACRTIYGRLPRKAIRWRRRLECTNLSGLLRDKFTPLALMGVRCSGLIT